jgi:hypothetical protein
MTATTTIVVATETLNFMMNRNCSICRVETVKFVNVTKFFKKLDEGDELQQPGCRYMSTEQSEPRLTFSRNVEHKLHQITKP